MHIHDYSNNFDDQKRFTKEYEIANGVYDPTWEFRCDVCDTPCKSRHGVKIHKARVHDAGVWDQDKQIFKHRLADEAVKVAKMTAQQKLRPCIMCEDSPLENVFKFKYLGTIFAADGRQCYDIDTRITTAKSRCGKLRNIFDCPHLPEALKIRLYAASICSLMTYGAETWVLDDRVCRKLNGANSMMLARITGRSFREEANPRTSRHNLVAQIRARRMRWVGHILRDEERRATENKHSSLIYQALWEQNQIGKRGNLLMDAPQRSPNLIKITTNKAAWKKMATAVSKSNTTTGPEMRNLPHTIPTPRREHHHAWSL